MSRFLCLIAVVMATMVVIWYLLVAGCLIVAYEGAERLCAWLWEPIKGESPDKTGETK